VYTLWNPFRKLPRLEYVYGVASEEGLDPIAPLLDDNVYDNYALVLVPDIYSVWPEVGAIPRSTSYGEVLDKLASYMRRSCTIRLKPRLCRRITYRVVPWRGVMGSWRFTASPPDALAYILHEMLEAAASLATLRTIYAVLDDEGDSSLKQLMVDATKLAAAALKAEVHIVAAEPRPYPAPRRAVAELSDYRTYKSTTLIRVLMSELLDQTIPPSPLRPVTPRGASFRVSRDVEEDYELTVASVLMAKQGLLVPLFYQACGAKDPIAKLRRVLAKLRGVYEAATELSKKIVGGTLRHHVAFIYEATSALALGAALERMSLELLGGPRACEALYRDGVEEDAIAELEEALGVKDVTPTDCVERIGSRLHLKPGCLKAIRRKLVETQPK
jgi:hypothetical protein